MTLVLKQNKKAKMTLYAKQRAYLFSIVFLNMNITQIQEDVINVVFPKLFLKKWFPNNLF